MTSRGPYKSAISGMTPEQAARWFKAQGQAAFDNRSTSYGVTEAKYVNAKFRCAGFAHKEGRGAHRDEQREWYCQGRFPGNAWRM